jgi:hypothetical protein
MCRNDAKQLTSSSPSFTGNSNGGTNSNTDSNTNSTTNVVAIIATIRYTINETNITTEQAACRFADITAQ